MTTFADYSITGNRCVYPAEYLQIVHQLFRIALIEHLGNLVNGFLNSLNILLYIFSDRHLVQVLPHRHDGAVSLGSLCHHGLLPHLSHSH